MRDDELAEVLISGSLQHSDSFHEELKRKTYGDIKRIAKEKNHPDKEAAKQMKKLIEESERLRQKAKRPRGRRR
jgi:hypothetical protein